MPSVMQCRQSRSIRREGNLMCFEDILEDTFEGGVPRPSRMAEEGANGCPMGIEAEACCCSADLVLLNPPYTVRLLVKSAS